MNYQNSSAPMYKISEIIPIAFEALEKDFSLFDIKGLVTNIFTKQELDAILQLDEKAHILKLMWTLYDKPQEDIEKFVNALQNDYKFIKDKICEEWIQPSQSTILYNEKFKELCSRDQIFTEYNVHRMTPYLELHTALKNIERHKYVVLLGVLGSGKKWLTMDVCSEYSVMRVMNFNIFWLNVRNCSTLEENLGMLQQLRHLVDKNYKFGSDTNCSSNIKHLISYMKTELQRLFNTNDLKDSLLILFDVKHKRTLKAFNLGCKTLVVTRDKRISDYFTPKLTTHIILEDKMTECEMACLFEKYMKCKRDKFPCNILHKIAKKTQNPLILSHIALNLRERNSDWLNWTDMQFDKSDKLTAIMERTLNVLSVDLLKLYAKLCIFPEDVDIPIELLAYLWHQNLSETKQILTKFSKQSLIRHDTAENCITLPNIYSTQLKHSKKIKELVDCQELHKEVIAYFKIPEILERKDQEFPQMLHYFYACIAHHLCQLQKDDYYSQLFGKIFLDFGFIEAKIRLESGSIMNTLKLLNKYQMQICGNNKKRYQLVMALRDFLPKVQEKFVQSADTCLLQCALFETVGGAIYEEAYRQVQRYPHQAWFDDFGSFHQRRQILDLGKYYAMHVQYISPDKCVVVKSNNDILMADLSLECNSNTSYLLGDTTPIEMMHIFNKERYLLTLHSQIGIKLWSLIDNVCDNNACATRLVRRTSSKLHVNPFYKNAYTQSILKKRKAKQVIDNSTYKTRKNIVAFYVHEKAPPYDAEINLHIAYDNGDVLYYEWLQNEQEFRKSSTPTLHTKQTDLRFLTIVLRAYYVMVTKTGLCSIWSLRNSAKVTEATICSSTNKSTQIVHMETYDINTVMGEQYTNVLMVFNNQVNVVSFLKKDFVDLKCTDLKPELLYEHTSDKDEAITCAKLSQDARILILGTKKGVIVYDMSTNLIIIRSNVSECIKCVNIYDLDDDKFRYIVLCGAVDKSVLHINALRKHNDTLTWAYNIEQHALSTAGDGNTILDARLEPDVRLCGQKLYDASYDDNGNINLYAVDTKYRVHEVCKQGNDNWSTIVPNATKYPITAITTSKKSIPITTFVGYKNGDILNINDDQLIEQKYFNQLPITYLKMLDADILIASTDIEPKTLVLNVLEKPIKPIPISRSCIKAYKLYEHYVICISRNGFLFMDLRQPKKMEFEMDRKHLYGYDLQKSLLFLATFDNAIFIYGFTGTIVKPTLLAKKEASHNDENNANVTVSCLSASIDATLFAVGLNNGNIEVYKYHDDQITYIYNLESHKVPIMYMRFSPLNRVLVSCAEQLCIWSLAHMLNNPLLTEQRTKRRSSRFLTRSNDNDLDDNGNHGNCNVDAGVEEVDAKAISPYHNYLRVRNSHSIDNLRVTSSPTTTTTTDERRRYSAESGVTYEYEQFAWLTKRGSVTKPELLSCIKFDGNNAAQFYANESFTQFHVIDDEGVYYHLILRDVQNHPIMQEPSRNAIIRLNADFNAITIGEAEHIQYIDDASDIDASSDDDDDRGVDVISDALKYHGFDETTTPTNVPMRNSLMNGNQFVSI